jgi:hypothetical protein
MGLFGPSRQERFVRREATGLAMYLKNNAVKFGCEAYAMCQVEGILPSEINKSLLWYFESVIFAFRVAQECLLMKSRLDQETFGTLFMAFVEVDNNHFAKIEHEPYKDVFAYVSDAAEVIKATSGRTRKDQA